MTGENTYTGTALGKTLKISQAPGSNDVILFNTSIDDFNKIWYNYFDMNTDYTEIKQKLSVSDEYMEKAAKEGYGIRILRQDLWETVVSFIISASNNIPRIKKIVEELCRCFGEPLEYEGNIYYSFPSAERLAPLEAGELACIKAGFRDKYIIDAARKFVSGEIDVSALYKADCESARAELKKINGVGDKVANCVILFGLHKTDAFPVDVWVKRIMEYCYFKEDTPKKEIERLAREKFGSLGGFAQQYLFYWARENRIGTEV